MTDPAPPSVPEARLDGWRRSETTVDRVFDLGGVTVTAATVVYEDERLRDRLREAAGLETTWRFFFAARVAVPGGSGSAALRRLVVRRATDGFVDRLTDRGFESVSEAERRRVRIAGREADAVRYDATCRAAAAALAVDGWLWVWPADEGFLLAGGAYPRSVREAPPDATAAVRDALDPAAFREELFGLIRATA